MMGCMTERETPDALAALLRWQASGATWMLRPSPGDAVVVELLTCDGGEAVGRLVSSEPEFVEHVRAEAARDLPR